MAFFFFNHVGVFLLPSITVIYYTDQFSYVELSLHSRNKSHLVMECNPSNVMVQHILPLRFSIIDMFSYLIWASSRYVGLTEGRDQVGLFLHHCAQGLAQSRSLPNTYSVNE